MKNYDKEVYRQHLSEIPQCKDPFNVTCYLRGVVDIANGFNTEDQAAGVLDKNDLIQECYLVLLKAWKNLDWDAIHASDEPQAMIWAYLKKTVKIQARDAIHNVKDGIRIPHNKRWEINETKNVDDFLTQLFPSEFFTDNAESLGLYEDDAYLIRYDVEQLGIGLNDMMNEYLSTNEKFVLETFFGVDRDKLSYRDIANILNTNQNNVRKIKQRGLQALKNQEVRSYLQTFYEL